MPRGLPIMLKPPALLSLPVTQPPRPTASRPLFTPFQQINPQTNPQTQTSRNRTGVHSPPQKQKGAGRDPANQPFSILLFLVVIPRRESVLPIHQKTRRDSEKN